MSEFMRDGSIARLKKHPISLGRCVNANPARSNIALIIYGWISFSSITKLKIIHRNNNNPSGIGAYRCDIIAVEI